MSTALPAIEPTLRWDEDGAEGSGQSARSFGVRPVLLELASGFDWTSDALLRGVCQQAYPRNAQFVTALITDPADMATLKGAAYAGRILRIGSGRARYAPLAAADARHDLELTSVGAAGSTVVAVIDDGIAFAHERFRRQTGRTWTSRIASLWDQGRGATAGSVWGRPVGFNYGRELKQSGIDQLLLDASHRGIVDEGQVYRSADYDGVAAPLTHGTHVLDLAAGEDPRLLPSARTPALIAVQLPDAASRDTSGGWLALNVVDALRYVDVHTAKNAKLVVNLSFGAMAGPHDGTTMIERAIEEMYRRRPRDFALVLPAGNGFRSRTHARVALAPGGTKSLAIDVRSDDPTETFVEFWHGAGADVSLRVDTPGGQALGPIAVDGAARLPGASGGVAAALYRDAPSTAQQRTMLCLQPCLRLEGRGATAEPGRWTVTLSAGAAGGHALVDAWIERDEPTRSTAYPSHRQAVFADDDTLADACHCGAPIDRKLTMNHLAHAPSAIVVGAAIDRVQPQVCDYSGCGGTAAGGATREPDVVALGDESITLPGIAAAGTRSGIVARMSGTSVAAPQVARRIAQWFAAATRPMTVTDIRAALRATARAVDDPCSATTGTARRGAGFID